MLDPVNSTFQAYKNGTLVQLPWSYFWADRHTMHRGGYPPDCKFVGFGSFGLLGKHFGITGRITVGADDYFI